jgi:chromosome segregation ATPase
MDTIHTGLPLSDQVNNLRRQLASLEKEYDALDARGGNDYGKLKELSDRIQPLKALIKDCEPWLSQQEHAPFLLLEQAFEDRLRVVECRSYDEVYARYRNSRMPFKMMVMVVKPELI